MKTKTYGPVSFLCEPNHARVCSHAEKKRGEWSARFGGEDLLWDLSVRYYRIATHKVHLYYLDSMQYRRE